ncbi:MAG: hypothetical protein HQ582_18225 [Planctomycetes bacterium]|nr:hypothetical protein [Planctomycetota bacterium]
MAINTTAGDVQFAAINADLPEEFTFASRDWMCNRVSMRETDLALLQAEVRQDVQVTLSVQKSLFTDLNVTAPAINDTLTYKAVTKLVLDISEGPAGQDMRLHLGEQFSPGR